MLTINRKGRAPLHIALPDFNKGFRCPGWSGEGWRSNRQNWCEDALPVGVRRWSLTVRSGARTPDVDYAGDLPGFYSWRIRRTNCCNTIVLPQLLFWFAPMSWTYFRGWRPAVGPALSHLGTTFTTLYWRLRARARRNAAKR